MVRRSVVAFAAVLLCGIAGRVTAATHASSFEAFPMTVDGLDPSTRSAGMGGASGAVFWGDITDHWANPALLGFVSGVRYTDDVTSFLPSGSLDFVARQTTAGFGGLGFSFVGEPLAGLGKRESAIHTTYGTAYTPTENVTIYQRVRSWGAGASLTSVLASAAQLRHQEAPTLTRHLDVAFGFSEKVEEAGITTTPPSKSRGVSRDLGFLFRTGTTLKRGGGDAMPLRLDASYGFSIVGSGYGHVGTSPIVRDVRNAIAAHASLETHPVGRRMLPLWLAPALAPLISLGVAYDAERVTVASAPVFDYSRNHYGAELGITRALTFQAGLVNNPHHSWEGTWGLAAALPLGRFGGVRYGYARVQAANVFLDDIPHRSWSVWLDPVAIAHRER